ncbi:hypothetical protein F4Z98_05975 [Candidatus Poribacteria bacterium]|nr:hypothetical protein [Candidatus Poribacteria bacterium]MYB01773.1 hypothetical protein [Candidatus Poribacteria bacterium]
MGKQWTAERKAKTRRANLLKRIQKKYSYDPNNPQAALFEADRQKAINAEFTAECEKNVAYYFEGAPVDLSHLPDPDSMDTYNSQRLWHDAEYRKHWEKKLNISFSDET